MAQSLKTGDKVRILTGDHKGETAEIVKVDKKNGKAMLKDINIRTRHIRRTQYNPQVGKKDIHIGIDLSNLRKEAK